LRLGPSFVALQHRNFRLIWIGLLVSFSGSMMQNAALLWHVSLLVPPGRKGLALGLVGLARVVPIVVFSLVSGVVADAWNRRRLMVGTQVCATLVALTLAALTFRGLSTTWPIYTLAAIGAAVGAFDMPARQALIPMLLPREHLPNAITLNTIMFQMASVGGPSLGGLIIAARGVGWVYLFNAVSFVFVIGALLLMRDVPDKVDRAAIDPESRSRAADPRVTKSGPRDDVSLHAALEGLRFVFRSPLIRSTMLLDFFATFFASATALLPIFAQDILHVGAKGYGWLYAAPSAGAMITSAAMVALTDRIERRGVALLWAVGAYGLATVMFGFSHWFWLTFFCLAITGAADTVSTIIRNVVRQLETPDRLRGRMISVNMVFFQGGPQLGEMEAGALANWFGAGFAVVSGGIGCLLVTAWIAAATPALRRYRSLRSTTRKYGNAIAASTAAVPNAIENPNL
jgi:MFS family permease